MPKYEVIREGRCKRMSLTKLRRTFDYYAGWTKSSEIKPPYTVITYRHGDRVKVLMYRLVAK